MAHVTLHAAGLGLPPGCQPCNLTMLGGLQSSQFLRKLAEPERCPGSCVPDQAFAIDGGTSFHPGDAVSWLRMKSSWVVRGYEPVESNCEHASQALVPYRPRASIVCKALGREPGTATFYADHEQQGSLSAAHERGGPTSATSIQVTTLDAEVGEREVFLLKLDLQGSEVAALQGAARLLKDERLAWLHTEFAPSLLQDAGTSGVEYLELLSRHGFGCRNFRERSYMPWWCNEYVNHSGGATKVCWTDLICGHRSVARFAAEWQTQLLGQYCNAQRRLCHGGGAGVSCSALHSNFRASCVGTR